jgi:hypothetical protein
VVAEAAVGPLERGTFSCFLDGLDDIRKNFG